MAGEGEGQPSRIKAPHPIELLGWLTTLRQSTCASYRLV
jgi:hypothetical protein